MKLENAPKKRKNCRTTRHPWHFLLKEAQAHQQSPINPPVFILTRRLKARGGDLLVSLAFYQAEKWNNIQKRSCVPSVSFLACWLMGTREGKGVLAKTTIWALPSFCAWALHPLAKATERTWVFLLWLPVLIAKFLLLEILPGEFPQFPCLPLITRNYVPMPHRGASRSSEENMHCGKIMRGFQNALQQHTYLVIPWCPSQ